eukprot:6019940-Alexandrium_andersonii.AAC.1
MTSVQQKAAKEHFDRRYGEPPTNTPGPIIEDLTGDGDERVREPGDGHRGGHDSWGAGKGGASRPAGAGVAS